jgi:zinc-ribbon family
VLIIFGIKRKAQRLATVFAMCMRCHTPAAQAITRVRTYFSLFFIPIIPLGSKYRQTCTMCGSTTAIDKQTADQMVASAAAPYSAPPAFPSSPVAPAFPAPAPPSPATFPTDDPSA